MLFIPKSYLKGEDPSECQLSSSEHTEELNCRTNHEKNKSSSKINLNVPGQKVQIGSKSYRIWSTDDDPEILRARRSQTLILPEIGIIVPTEPRNVSSR
jgi:hypothetical protein